MLSLSRKAGEKIVLTVGAIEIEVVYLGMRNGMGRIGIEAPKDVLIMREELLSGPDKIDGRRDG